MSTLKDASQISGFGVRGTAGKARASLYAPTPHPPQRRPLLHQPTTLAAVIGGVIRDFARRYRYPEGDPAVTAAVLKATEHYGSGGSVGGACALAFGRLRHPARQAAVTTSEHSRHRSR